MHISANSAEKSENLSGNTRKTRTLHVTQPATASRGRGRGGRGGCRPYTRFWESHFSHAEKSVHRQSLSPFRRDGSYSPPLSANPDRGAPTYTHYHDGISSTVAKTKDSSCFISQNVSSLLFAGNSHSTRYPTPKDDPQM